MASQTGKDSIFKVIRVAVPAAILILAFTACGFTAPRSNNGYADLDSPGMSDTNRTMSLSLGPTILHFAARFLDDEPETQALLRSLDGVRVLPLETRRYVQDVHVRAYR